MGCWNDRNRLLSDVDSPAQALLVNPGKTLTNEVRFLVRNVEEDVLCVNVESEAELELLSSIAAWAGVAGSKPEKAGPSKNSTVSQAAQNAKIDLRLTTPITHPDEDQDAAETE